MNPDSNVAACNLALARRQAFELVASIFAMWTATFKPALVAGCSSSIYLDLYQARERAFWHALRYISHRASACREKSLPNATFRVLAAQLHTFRLNAAPNPPRMLKYRPSVPRLRVEDVATFSLCFNTFLPALCWFLL